MSQIFAEVHRTLNQPSTGDIFEQLIHSSDSKDWATVIDDINLC